MEASAGVNVEFPMRERMRSSWAAGGEGGCREGARLVRVAVLVRAAGGGRPLGGRRAVLRGVLGAGLVEGLEDRLGLLVVVVDDVHEAVCVHEAIDELARRRVGLVELGPLPAELVRLVLTQKMTSQDLPSRLTYEGKR